MSASHSGSHFSPRPFRPATWASGSHTQTIVARLLRPAETSEPERERITTPDDDFLDLDWGPDPGAGAPIALVVHGLEGSARRRYVRSMCENLSRTGVWPVALNLRGCSGEPNRALHFYHSGKTDDPALVLRLLRERYPDRALGAVGFSLGGNMILKLMGERSDGGRSALDAAVAISVPYDLAAGCSLLERTRMGRVYTAYFLRSLKAKLRMKAERLREVLDIEAALAARTIWEFDDLATAPLHGFASAAEYYAESSSAGFLTRIGVATLMIHAEDDPFLPPDAIPVAAADRNPALYLALHSRGGHVGFLQGSPWRPSFWAEEEAARFLAERLGTRGRSASSPPSEKAGKIP